MAERMAMGCEVSGNPSKKWRMLSCTEALEAIRPRNFERFFEEGNSP